MIDRREFLGGALALGATGALAHPLAGLLTSSAGAATAPSATPSNGHTLVLCTLYGGNDGLNTLVPYQDPHYYDLRPEVAINAGKVLPMPDGLGLNPALPGLKALFDAGLVAIVRGVGYPNMSLSHFQAMAIWQTASPSGDTLTGWLGRWLDRTRPDPLRACSVGPTVALAMSGNHARASAAQDSTYGNDQLPDASHELLSAYRQLQRPHARPDQLENQMATSGANMLSVSRTFAGALNNEPAPKGLDDGDIGNQFDIVSSFIRAGLPTQAYAISQGGYDTHSGELGTQSEQLGQLDTAITSFWNSLAGHPNAAGTVIVIYTEFGRRAGSNGSDGTDHGTANNVIVIGPTVKGGYYGDQPSLTNLDENGNLLYNVDFRSVYATVLEHVIGVDSKPFLGHAYPLLGFI